MTGPMCIGCGQLHACLVNVSVFKHWHGILAVSTAGITLGGLSLRCSMREAHHGRGVAGCYVALVCNYAGSHNMLLEFREAHITLVDAEFSWSDKKRTGFHGALKKAQTLLAEVETLRGNILWNGHLPNGDYPVVCFFCELMVKATTWHILARGWDRFLFNNLFNINSMKYNRRCNAKGKRLVVSTSLTGVVTST